MQSNNPGLIKEFLSYLRAERGAGNNSIESYSHDVTDFAGFVGKSLRAAVRADLQRYIVASLELGLSGRTVARRLSCLRSFYRFLLDEEEIKIDPTFNLPVPKSWKTVPRALGLIDLDKMVASCCGTSWIDLRDRAMLLTFFASGLRVSELARLKVDDIDLDAGAAKVWNGKGGKDALVPLSPPSVLALRIYFETVRPRLAAGRADNPYAFLGQSGKHLHRQSIWCRVRKVAQVAIGKRVSPHFLRHGFATALVEGGADIREVCELLRHSDVNTSAIYVHTDLNYMRRIYYASHPRARISQASN